MRGLVFLLFNFFINKTSQGRKYVREKIYNTANLDSAKFIEYREGKRFAKAGIVLMGWPFLKPPCKPAPSIFESFFNTTPLLILPWIKCFVALITSDLGLCIYTAGSKVFICR